MNLSLTGTRALVGGSTQGIGRASAVVLARLGATVTLIARDPEALAQTAAALPAEGGQRHDFVTADFAEPDIVRDIVADALGDGRRYEILINNTGGPKGGPAIDADEEQYVAAFRMHLSCNQVLAQALVPGMKDAGYGRIINIISTSVREPIPGLGVSNTIRGAVASWAKTISNELAPFGITVNNVLPGFTETTRLASLIRSKAEARGTSEDAIADEMKAGVPAARFATAEEVANAFSFFASPAAGYVTGQSLAVDGGRLGSI